MKIIELTDDEAAIVVRALNAFAGPRLAYVGSKHSAPADTLACWRDEAQVAEHVKEKLT